MNGAYTVFKWTAQSIANQAKSITGKAKDYTLSWASPIVLKVANSQMMTSYLTKYRKKNSVIYTYIRGSKDIGYVVIILFISYYIVKGMRSYTKWRQRKNQEYIEKLILKKQMQREKEDDLKFRLFKEILEHDFEYKDPRQRSRHDKFYMNGYESDLDETTNHGSCKFGEDECAHGQNGNISEISYGNDVSDKPVPQSHSHKKMLEYLGAYIHNSKECEQMKLINDKKYLDKKFKKFQAKFSKYRDEVLIKSCHNNYDFAGENPELYNKEESKEIGDHSHHPHKVLTISKNQNETLKNVNFFEILSQLGEQFTNDNEKVQRLNKNH